MEEFNQQEDELKKAIRSSDGSDIVGIYIKDTKQMKKYPSNLSVKADSELVEKLAALFGKDNVKITQS